MNSRPALDASPRISPIDVGQVEILRHRKRIPVSARRSGLGALERCYLLGGLIVCRVLNVALY